MQDHLRNEFDLLKVPPPHLFLIQTIFPSSDDNCRVRKVLPVQVLQADDLRDKGQNTREYHHDLKEEMDQVLEVDLLGVGLR